MPFLSIFSMKDNVQLKLAGRLLVIYCLRYDTKVMERKAAPGTKESQC